MLEIESLQAGYQGRAVAQLANLCLAPGEHALLLGPSGSGKTTLLYAIAGLLTPMAGRVALNGTDVTTLSPAARDRFRGQHMGIIYQTLRLVPALTLTQNILLASYSAGLPQDVKRAERLLLQLGLHDKRDQLPETLSHGQQQRVAIARAAINKPQLILGDEPTSALDDHHCQVVMQLLIDAASGAKASLVIATHDTRLTRYFSHTIRLGEAA